MATSAEVDPEIHFPSEMPLTAIDALTLIVKASQPPLKLHDPDEDELRSTTSGGDVAVAVLLPNNGSCVKFDDIKYSNASE
jgi:hypothetical protein